MDRSNIVEFPRVRVDCKSAKSQSVQEISLESITGTLNSFKQSSRFKVIVDGDKNLNKKGLFYQNTYNQIQRENKELGTLLIKLVNVSERQLYDHTTYYVALYNWIIVLINISSPWPLPNK